VINKYPLWKNLIVVGAIALGIVYSLPNVYPPDFAIQVSMEASGELVDVAALDTTKKTLDGAGLEYFDAEIVKGNVLVRFPDDTTQLKAKPLVERAIHDLPNDYVVALTSADSTPDWLTSIRAEPMKYGLDLRGGMHFLMEVDTESVVTNRIENLGTDVKRQLREEKLRYKSVESPSRGVLVISFANEDIRDAARTLLESQYIEFQFSNTSGELPSITLIMTQNAIDEVEDFAISQNLQTIRNRVNELGVSEPLVQRLGRNRIVVDLPGVQDPTIAKKILGKVATLEFRFEALPNAPRSTTITFDYEGRPAELEMPRLALIPNRACPRLISPSTVKAVT